MRNNFRNAQNNILLMLIALVIIAAVTVIIMSLRQDPASEALKQDEMIKILIVLNDGEGNALATDVLAYYPPSRQGTVFGIEGNIGAIYQSLLRDDGQRGRTDRIDAVYRERGVETYCREIESLTGMSIPYTLEINLENFSLLTDLLGGLRVFVPSQVDVVGGDNERWLLPSGAVTLDGDKIKTYIRYRLPEETESDQEEHRQNAMIALLSAVHDNRDIILNKQNFSVFSSKATYNVRDDMAYAVFEQVSRMENADRLSADSIKFITGRERMVDGQQLLFPEYDGQLVRDIVGQLTNSLVQAGMSVNRVYSLEIQNGTSVQGSARNASFLLQGLGYKVEKTTNADRNTHEHTMIIDHIGDKAAVNALASFITCKYIVEDVVAPESAGYETQNIDFTIVLGADWDGRYVRGGYTNLPDEPENLDVSEEE